jgi:hypothetical protein
VNLQDLDSLPLAPGKRRPIIPEKMIRVLDLLRGSAIFLIGSAPKTGGADENHT